MNAQIEQLVNYLLWEANVAELEDFLGYPISADVLESKESCINEVLAQMPEEELQKFINKYIKN